MTYDAHTATMTDEELVREYRVSDDPTVRELARRLDGALADNEELDRDMERLKKLSLEEYENWENETEEEVKRQKEEWQAHLEEKLQWLRNDIRGCISRLCKVAEFEQLVSLAPNLKQEKIDA